MIRRRHQRRGYAMVMVVLFVTLMLGLWGLASREIGAMLRIEQARAARVKRDMDTLPAKMALARAMAALEVGFPPSSPMTRGLKVGNSFFSLTFVRDPHQPDEWIIQVAPAAEEVFPPLDPSMFSATTP